MIITELNGGLGNQMFQYAFGCAAAIRTNSELRTDDTALLAGQTSGMVTPRQYELGIFNLEAKIATAEDRRRFFPETLLGKASRKMLNSCPVINENVPSTQLQIPVIQRDAFLRGYWQSEKYFKDQEARIRDDFEFTAPKNKETIALAEKIKNVNAVSVHVRRGDYAANAHTKSFHGLMDLDYYEQAMKIIEQKSSQPIYFFFSDDADWVQQEIIRGEPGYSLLEHNTGADSWQDMYLMSLCKNHIIANSSFSWWGAWLSTNNEKKVVAPKQWFANADANLQTIHLTPASWQRI